MNSNEKKSIGFEIRILSNLIRRHINNSASHTETESVTGMNGWMIVYLAHNSDRDVFQRDLEERFNVRRSTVSNILSLMEKKGLIKRESVECDARLKKLTLTEKSLELLEKMENDRVETEKLITDGIPEEELAMFISVAERMKQNLEKCDGEMGPGDGPSCLGKGKKI